MNWCAFDVEGRVPDGIEGVAIWSDTTTEYITDTTDALRVLKDHASSKYTLVAHNAEYDIETLFWQLGVPVRMVYANGRFNRGEWDYGNKRRKCQIWDTLRLSNGLSLQQMGKALNCPKYDTPQRLRGIDPNKYEWQCDLHKAWECEVCYALRDAEIVYRYIQSYEQFMGQYEAKPKRTTGSSAVALWRALDRPDACNLITREQDDIARAGYFGGRTEVFSYGHVGKLYTADVSSMYPYIMTTTPMPVAKSTNLLPGPDVGEHVLEHEGMSDCTIYIPSMHVPPLPVLKEHKLYFPVGLVRGMWTHLELRAAIARGCEIHHIHRSLVASEVCYPFTQFITTMMAHRDAYKKDHDPRELTVKILTNALYGRLGLGREQESTTHELVPSGKGSKDYRGYKFTYVAGHAFVYKSMVREVFTPYANVLWAATITASARLRLLAHIEAQGKDIVYCDTDSVFSRSPIIGLSEGFGQLSDTGEWEYARIMAPKMYHLRDSLKGDRYKCKGVPQRVAEEFMRNGKAKYETVMRPKQAARRHLQPGIWLLMEKSWKHAPAKRHILDPSWLLSEAGMSDTVPVSFDVLEAVDPVDPSP